MPEISPIDTLSAFLLPRGRNPNKPRLGNTEAL